MRINLSVVLCMNGDFWESPVEQDEIIQISPSLYIILFIYLILFFAVLSLHCFVRAFSTCTLSLEWELLFIGVSGLLIVVVSLLIRCRLQAFGLSRSSLYTLERWLSSCGTWVQLLLASGIFPDWWSNPMSPALAADFLSTAPPGKSLSVYL